MTDLSLIPYYIIYIAPRCIICSTKKAAFGAKGSQAIAFKGTIGGNLKEKCSKWHFL